MIVCILWSLLHLWIQRITWSLWIQRITVSVSSLAGSAYMHACMRLDRWMRLAALPSFSILHVAEKVGWPGDEASQHVVPMIKHQFVNSILNPVRLWSFPLRDEATVDQSVWIASYTDMMHDASYVWCARLPNMPCMYVPFHIYS